MRNYKKDKIIILYPQKFKKFDLDRYEIEYLKKNLMSKYMILVTYFIQILILLLGKIIQQTKQLKNLSL